MIRRPPRSTLFPYTTALPISTDPPDKSLTHLLPYLEEDDLPARRSEEHTSELQSRLHLVCRLLLEKKKSNHRKSLTYSRAIRTRSSLVRSSVPTRLRAILLTL